MLYKNSKLIHTGKSTTIYKVYRTDLKKEILVKVQNEHYADEFDKLKNEFSILKKLNFNGVPKVLELSEFQGERCICLEFLEGISLKKFIQNNPFNLELFLKISIQIADILAKIHNEKTIHGDLASNNILIDNKDHVTVIDFELARPFTNSENSSDSRKLKGTVPYISPEQTGKLETKPDYRSDLYSLGVILYELFTGKLVFTDKKLAGIIHSHIAEAPQAPKEINKDIPDILSSLILKLLSKNPDDRYRSAQGLKFDLEYIQKYHTRREALDFELGKNDYSGRLNIPRRLIGREKETEALVSAMQDAAQGKFRLTLISGDSGCGKTMLINDFIKNIPPNNTIFIKGKFEEFDSSKPYSAIIEALKTFFLSILMQPKNETDYWKRLIQDATEEQAYILSEFIPETELIIGQQLKAPDLGGAEAKNRLYFVLSNFIKAAGTKQHPLLLFFDDFQRADNESVKLISNWLDTDMSFSHFIFAYRTKEIPIQTIELLRNKRLTKKECRISNFNEKQVNQYIKHSLLPHTAKDFETLSALIYKKTNGNPFFLKQFLISLYEQNQLHFNFETSEWEWDLELIKKKTVTDNVIEFLKHKLHSLPAETQKTLKTAACIGNKFKLDTVASVQEQNIAECLNSIRNATAQTFLISEHEDKYTFVHDKVHQAVYQSIKIQDRTHTHRKIAALLQNRREQTKDDEHIFDLVRHLNAAEDLIPEEVKQSMAELNRAAAHKAKASLAYNAAFNYLETALKLKKDSVWSGDYSKALNLYNELCELAFLSGRYEKTEFYAQEIKAKAKTTTDKVRSVNNLINSYRAQADFARATTVGFEILSEFKVNFPKSPKLFHLILSSIRTSILLKRTSLKKLMNMEFAVDELGIAKIELLATLSAFIYTAHPYYTPLFIFKAMRLIAKYGHTPSSPYTFVGYGLTLAVLNKIPRAVEFGRAAEHQIEKNNLLQVKTKAVISRLMYIDNRVKTPEEFKKGLFGNYLFAEKQGDFEFAGISLYAYAYSHFHSHNKLSEVKTDMLNHRSALRKLKQADVSIRYELLLQLIENLEAEELKPDDVLKGQYFERESGIKQISDNKDASSLSWFYMNQLLLCYMLDFKKDTKQTLQNYSAKIDPSRGCYFHAFAIFIYCLSLLRYISKENAKQTHKIVKKYINQIQIWAKFNHRSFKHKLYLIKAERARVLEKPEKAKKYYDLAVNESAENGFFIEEALAWENAGRFYYFEQQNLSIAQSYLKNAYKKYRKWGAVAKLNQLKTAYPDINFVHEDYFLSDISNSLYSTSILDLKSIKRANESLLSEIELDSLLKSLLKILLENTGADYAVIINNEEGNYFVQAKGSSDTKEFELLDSVKLEECEDIPADLISYSITTKKPVTTDDINRNTRFGKSDYFKKKPVQSVLCYPVVRQKEVKAVLYLENRLTVGVFSLEIPATLNIISSQIAISIENALLYKNLEDLVNKRTKALRKSEEELKLSNDTKDRFFSIIAHDLKGPFGSIIGLTDILKNGFDKMSDKEKIEIVNAINNSTQKTYKLLENLLTWARSQTGKIEFLPTKINLNKIVCSAISTLKSQADRKEIKLNNKLTDDLILRADANMLETVLRNLISNAVKFTPKKGKLTVSAKEVAKEDKSFIKITVSDTGVGIESSKTEQLFSISRDKLSKGTEGEPGTGLGLIICKEFIDKHKGEIWVESEPGKGSDFIFTIPTDYRPSNKKS